MLKKIDNNGRIVIPIDIRRELDMNEEYVDVDIIKVNGEKQIVIKRTVCKCDICGCEENVESVLDKNICSECIKKLRQYYNNAEWTNAKYERYLSF